MKSVVITSTGRTGTYFLYRLLSESCPECAVFHNSRYTTILNILGNMHISGLLPESALRQAWQILKSSEVKDLSLNTYIDSNNHLYALVSIAPDLYPNLSVVHLVRDPRDYVRSHLNWAYTRSKSYFANFIIPFWQPNAFLVNEMNFKQWLLMSRFERFCWIWDFKNRYIPHVNKKNIPYLLVRVEDVFNQTESVYTSLSNFIGIRINMHVHRQGDNNLNQSSADQIPHWIYWSDRKCAILHEHCGELMQKYNYADEQQWQDKVANGRRCLSREGR